MNWNVNSQFYLQITLQKSNVWIDVPDVFHAHVIFCSTTDSFFDLYLDGNIDAGPYY